jgi:hypothetical protein
MMVEDAFGDFVLGGVGKALRIIGDLGHNQVTLGFQLIQLVSE